jgi:uridine kinase
MKEHLIALKNLETIVSPRYDFVTCVSNPDGDVKKPAKVVLTEGLYVLNEEVRDIMDVKVYVFTPLDVIKERWYKRAVSRGKTGEAADLQFKDVNETAQKYIRPNYLIADCIINGMVSEEYIKNITDRIMQKLAEIC